MVEEEVQQVKAAEAAHARGHGCKVAPSGPHPRACHCPSPTTQLAPGMVNRGVGVGLVRGSTPGPEHACVGPWGGVSIRV